MNAKGKNRGYPASPEPVDEEDVNPVSGLIDFDAASDSADGDGVRGAGSNAHSDDGVSTHSDNGSPTSNAADSAECAGDTAEDDSVRVMLVSSQDPLLVPTYLNLPSLPRLCEVKSFTGTTDSFRTPFSETCAKMTKEEVQAFLKVLLFVHSGQFVNTARVDPAELYVDNYRLRVRKNKSLAVCIMSGTVTESFLLSPCESGPRHAPYSIHKVSIAPLEQDMR